ncbi:MAG: 3-oxoacyl-[acyl-carrier-protein] synthase III C-terminal domain-containing protein [Bacillota bacterium]
MAGIISYGAYIPFNRLDRKLIREMYGNPVPKGEKAVANFDEDSLTMAVAAALDCTVGFRGDEIERLYFATTTPPHREKQAAATIAGTLDMKSQALTLDVTGSLRSGSSALIAGLDAAEKGEKVVVTVSDSRLGAAAGQFEALLGDGAAAFMLGNQDVIAEIIGYQSISADFYDNWRSTGDRFVRSWEERFCQTQGYNRFTVEAAAALMKRLGLKQSDFSKVVIYGLKADDGLGLARRMGFAAEQVQDSLIDRIGNTGAASAPMALVAALEEASPGDRILMITYGDGSDAIAFQVTEKILKLPPRRGIRGHIDSKKSDMNYGKYLRWRELIEVEPQRRPPLVRSSLPDRYRNLKKILGFYGSRCLVCDTPQFPAQRVCINCQAMDQMEDYKFLGKKARLATFTLDYLAPSLDPPTVMAVVDYEGGGRFVCLMTDCLIDQLAVNMEVEMSFRKLFEVEGIGTYFWKAIPKR